jgi:hypothetical protein
MAPAAPAAVTAPGAAPPVAAAPPAPEPIAPKIERDRRDVSPPPPPPPPKTVTRELAPPRAAAAPAGAAKGAKGAGDEVDGLGITGTGAGGGGGGAAQPGLGGIGSVGRGGGPARGEQTSLLRAKSQDITACWAGQKMTVQMHIVIKADGTASATLSSKEKLTPQIEACVKKVISTIEFPAKAAVISIGFSSTP